MLDLKNVQNVCVPLIKFTPGFMFIMIYAPMDSNNCNNTRPVYTPHSISDVQYSCFLCCTKFLFSVLYKIPVFSDVQYSCMSCCSFMMYNIPVFHVVP